ncbi:MAG: adenylate kinase [Dehalococcoidales bacterium]
MYNIAFVGAPGSGKGTQAAAIARKLNILHIATGDLFRQAAGRGDELGNKVRSYLEKGELVPDDITIGLVKGQLAASGSKGAVLDGFPRNIRQAEALDEALDGQVLDKVIYIRVSEAELTRRLNRRRVCRECQATYMAGEGETAARLCRRCGGRLERRADDGPETVRKRYAVYMAETAPLIGYYAARGKLAEVDGQGSIDEVNGRIMAALGRQESLT